MHSDVLPSKQKEQMIWPSGQFLLIGCHSASSPQLLNSYTKHSLHFNCTTCIISYVGKVGLCEFLAALDTAFLVWSELQNISPTGSQLPSYLQRQRTLMTFNGSSQFNCFQNGHQHTALIDLREVLL